MGWMLNAALTGAVAFIATNIDDIVILTLFFAQVNARFRPKHIVIGQYLGFTVLILASLPGFVGGLLIAPEWIGLLGLLPIAIALKQWLSRDGDDDTVQTIAAAWGDGRSGRSLFAAVATVLTPQACGVAAVTVANGGDNVGIYVPLFANLNLASLGVTLMVFGVLLGLWCGLAARLASTPAIAPLLSRYSHILVPVVLMGLGLFILLENKTYRLLGWG